MGGIAIQTGKLLHLGPLFLGWQAAGRVEQERKSGGGEGLLEDSERARPDGLAVADRF